MRYLALALALLAIPAATQARGPREMTEIEAGRPITIRTDRAYLLMRSFRPEGSMSVEPVLLRIPRAEELEQYAAARHAAFVRAEPGLIRQREARLQRNAAARREGRTPREPDPPPVSEERFNFVYDDIQNLQAVDQSRPLMPGRPENLYLVEVIPGDYVFYGLSFGKGISQLYTCLCLGTVGFTAQAGVVTDLGTFLGDLVAERSSIPELRAESGFGQSTTSLTRLLGATIRPARADGPTIDLLRGTTIRPAVYRAIGRFTEPRAMSINRLAPISGVLSYDQGRVLDVATGRVVPDRP